MGLFTKDIKTMDDLFLHTLQDIYYAENQIVKALPGMIEKATNRDLSAGFKTHLEAFPCNSENPTVTCLESRPALHISFGQAF